MVLSNLTVLSLFALLIQLYRYMHHMPKWQFLYGGEYLPQQYDAMCSRPRFLYLQPSYYDLASSASFEVVIFFCNACNLQLNLMRWMMISRGSKYYYASSYYVYRLLDYAFIVVLLEQFGAGRWELTVIMVMIMMRRGQSVRMFSINSTQEHT